MSGEYLTLKWGSLKAWNFEETNQRALELLKKWAAGGVSMSAMCHHDTSEQKQIICELIDVGDFDTVYLDWDDKEVSKDEAKNYVMNYGQPREAQG
jgi:hypothetical protein